VGDQRVEIPGSAPKFRATDRWLSPTETNQKIGATIILRRRSDPARDEDLQEQLLSGRSKPVSREQAAQTLNADPGDLAAVRSFLEQHGLSVTRDNAEARTLHVEGTAEQMSDAFGVRLGCFEDADGHQYLSYEGPLSIPKSLDGVITAVLGLDQRPIAKHHRAVTGSVQ
jgi:kumamolisin